MCGEMAGEPMYAMVLLGLGLDELSMNSTAIPVVKSVLRGASLTAARELATAALSMATAQEIEQMVQEVMFKRYPAELLRAAGELNF
jgi:phosphotransferase system enzyme I (PtsI)